MATVMYEGIEVDINAGTFRVLLGSEIVTRPLSPENLKTMREIGVDEFFARTTAGRFLEKGRKHGGSE